MFTRFLNGLETRFGRFAIPNLMRALALFKGIVFVLILINPAIADGFALVMPQVLKGEVWRLVTFLLLPASTSVLWFFFEIIILILCGDALEHAWGSFKLNVFYFTGAFFTILAACFLGGGTSFYLNSSIFFAFATLFPLVELRVFFVLPVQVRWIALVQALVFIGMAAVSGWGQRAMIFISFVNYFLFFGPAFVSFLRTRQQVMERRAKFESSKIPEDEPMHRCKTCGRTENDDPYLDFRVAGDGEEYCAEHLPAKVAT